MVPANPRAAGGFNVHRRFCSVHRCQCTGFRSFFLWQASSCCPSIVWLVCLLDSRDTWRKCRKTLQKESENMLSHESNWSVNLLNLHYEKWLQGPFFPLVLMAMLLLVSNIKHVVYIHIPVDSLLKKGWCEFVIHLPTDLIWDRFRFPSFLFVWNVPSTFVCLRMPRHKSADEPLCSWWTLDSLIIWRG